jgi:holliday junction DNA helicase RuvB
MIDEENRLLSAEYDSKDIDLSIRPASLKEFTGQDEVCNNLKIYIQAAKSRNESLDHVLLYGPPGLGKTTLAQIIAKEMGVGFRITSGPMISKAGDLAAILTNLQINDVLFIDEIHRLSASVEEILYSAMEDFKLDIIIGEGPSARSIRLDLPNFTLVGATTRTGLLSQPLRERFGIPLRLQLYDVECLTKIISRAAGILNTQIDFNGAKEIAKRSRGTPRIAGRLLKRVRDFATVFNSDVIEEKMANDSLDKLEVDILGLDSQDLKYLYVINDFYNGGPVGAETIAAALSEQKDTIEEVLEPYLLQIGFVQRTPRGRILTKKAQDYLLDKLSFSS